MCVYMYTHTKAATGYFRPLSVCKYMFLRICVNSHVCEYISIHVNIYVCMNICVYIFTHT